MYKKIAESAYRLANTPEKNKELLSYNISLSLLNPFSPKQQFVLIDNNDRKTLC